ncbi:Flagellar basal-body rod protein FlgG [Planctomycetes bacterium Poly30]|uniref:Flagellar basal-body rod protein FlgG n=1 Tax=Saltatorellus ferox TaxID=2528018 RepID=A0A518EZY5_9BACT|nr:Flagellar basal-body rod protein FlgG [Planctomycetes bacterium Poly30]
MMTLATTLLFTVAMLAACQSATPSATPDEPWRTEMESSQAELTREVKALHALLAIRGPEPSGNADVTAGLVTLGDRLDVLSALLADTRGAQVASASYSSATPTYLQEVKVLQEGLLVLEAQRAAHCENIAHASVTAYKRRRLSTLANVDEASGTRVPEVGKSHYDIQQGVLQLTGDMLDFGIEGRGFFEIQLPNGDLRYQRDGSFRQDFDGRLVTVEGYRLNDEVTIPSDCQGISVSTDGQCFAHGESFQITQIGTIRLHTFGNESALAAAGRNGFFPTAASGDARGCQPGFQGAGVIKQGYLEQSNVNLTEEVIALQSIERQIAAIRQALAVRGIYLP